MADVLFVLKKCVDPYIEFPAIGVFDSFQEAVDALQRVESGVAWSQKSDDLWHGVWVNPRRHFLNQLYEIERVQLNTIYI